mmetsp:Transcript_22180/g.52755  ORF Transcript_22180/g.52755 Transcript_22180/m.52755 type:complete len:256 (+) Transcript_22180:111-878(+)
MIHALHSTAANGKGKMCQEDWSSTGPHRQLSFKRRTKPSTCSIRSSFSLIWCSLARSSSSCFSALVRWSSARLCISWRSSRIFSSHRATSLRSSCAFMALSDCSCSPISLRLDFKPAMLLANVCASSLHAALASCTAASRASCSSLMRLSSAARATSRSLPTRLVISSARRCTSDMRPMSGSSLACKLSLKLDASKSACASRDWRSRAISARIASRAVLADSALASTVSLRSEIFLSSSLSAVLLWAINFPSNSL